MTEPEFYHTGEEYQEQGIGPFLSHVKQYLEGKRTIPVSKSNHPQGSQKVFFTFSDDLLKQFANGRADELKKPYEVAVKYGFRGYSLGGKNGIFYQNEDSALVLATNRLIRTHQEELKNDLSLENLVEIKKVKIVWHNPSGRRIVGAYNLKNNRVFFLDWASYRKV